MRNKGVVKLAAPNCSGHLERKIDPLNLFDAPVHDSGNGISEKFVVGEGEEHRQNVSAISGTPPRKVSQPAKTCREDDK